LGLVGLDSISAIPRLTLDRMELIDGVGLVPIVMGLFGVAEILTNLEQRVSRAIFTERIKGLLPSRQDWSESAAPLARGSMLGFLLGILPGGGAVISSFVSYALEKRLSKTPEKFGKGAIAGVAGPEAANNAAASSGFIPLLTLGIPPNVVVALLLGAFIVHNVQPGPLLMTQNPGLFWGIVASMYIGNIMLLILNLPLIGLWVQVLKVPYRILFPLILLFCLIGVYSISGTPGARLRAGTDDGEQPAPGAHHIRRQLLGLRRAAHLARLPPAGAGAARLRRPAGIAQAARAHRGGDELSSASRTRRLHAPSAQCRERRSRANT
jgi:putative tricarboxylic transport membrane protein